MCVFLSYLHPLTGSSRPTTSVAIITSPSLTLMPISLLLSYTYKDPCNCIGLTWIIQGNLPISISWIESPEKPFLLLEVMYSLILKINIWTFLWGGRLFYLPCLIFWKPGVGKWNKMGSVKNFPAFCSVCSLNSTIKPIKGLTPWSCTGSIKINQHTPNPNEVVLSMTPRTLGPSLSIVVCLYPSTKGVRILC